MTPLRSKLSKQICVLQANSSCFQPAAAESAHDHGVDPVQYYLKAASEVALADVQCIIGDCCVCLSTAARRVGNPAFAVEQAELALGAAKACKCSRLHAAAQGSLAIATFQMNRSASKPLLSRPARPSKGSERAATNSAHLSDEVRRTGTRRCPCFGKRWHCVCRM